MSRFKRAEYRAALNVFRRVLAEYPEGRRSRRTAYDWVDIGLDGPNGSSHVHPRKLRMMFPATAAGRQASRELKKLRRKVRDEEEPAVICDRCAIAVCRAAAIGQRIIMVDSQTERMMSLLVEVKRATPCSNCVTILARNVADGGPESSHHESTLIYPGDIIE